MKQDGLLRDIWALLRPFWLDLRNWPAHLLLVSIITLNLGSVWLSVWFNEWYRRFYNALQEYDEAAFWHEIGMFTFVAFAAIVVAIYRLFLNQWLSIRWREWMTRWLIDDWLDRRAYYRMQIDGTQMDNPDQRVSEDVRLFVEYSLGLSVGLLREIASLISFGIILWTISGPLTIPAFGGEVVIPGYMVFAAFIYAAIGTIGMHWVGKPLIRLNFFQQKVEADFRFGLVRFRENAEGVALYRGEEGERRSLAGLFGAIVGNYWSIMWRRKKMTTLAAFYGQTAVIIPFVVAAPRYFARAIDLGTLLQISNAFGQVQGSLSWFIDTYVALTEYKASIDRLTGFRRVIAAARQTAADGLAVTAQAAPALSLAEGLRVDLPNGTPLVAAAEGLTVRPGDRVLVTGPSGSGKSTLFRAIAGLWPFGSGAVTVPGDARVLFLPQRPYLPLGTLREVVAYPAEAMTLADTEIREALATVDLGHLAGDLDRVDAWSRRLSPGEQQRLAIARALLYRPDWLFLDEPTAAVDETTAEKLFDLLQERLPGATILTISHQADVARHHGRHWALRRRTEGPALIEEVAAPA